MLFLGVGEGIWGRVLIHERHEEQGRCKWVLNGLFHTSHFFERWAVSGRGGFFVGWGVWKMEFAGKWKKKENSLIK